MTCGNLLMAAVWRWSMASARKAPSESRRVSPANIHNRALLEKKMTPKLSQLMLTVALLGFSFVITGQAQTPQFKDYAVSERFTGKVASPVLTSESRNYRTRLREAARGKPNFAGHFIVTYWG